MQCLKKYQCDHSAATLATMISLLTKGQQHVTVLILIPPNDKNNAESTASSIAASILDTSLETTKQN